MKASGNPTQPGARHSIDQSDRRKEIAAHVMEAGEVSVEDLAKFCDVSIMTIYRDVAVLEKAGVVHRSRGKVVASASGLHEATARYRLSQGAQSKEEMARAVAPLIAPGSSVLLDDSTSSVWVLRELKNMAPLSVVTNSSWSHQSSRGTRDIPCCYSVVNTRHGRKPQWVRLLSRTWKASR